uniref:Uncharacterized protein n=1 Tax=uncultured prokaryote TaxID=198431 RepID=A0A0H5Q409_9ZZZZ|nr:hypothetical protein [uncultured prokaryote]
MSAYRVVVRHVRYWRGNIHHWSTVYPLTGSLSAGNYAGLADATHTLEQAVNFKGLSIGGGVYEIAIYNQATGGVPVYVASYFDPATPASWVAYGSSGWGTSTENLESAAEVALQVEWAAGLGSSGKPVYFRKWYHSVPVTSSSTASAADVSTSRLTTLGAAFTTWSTAVGALGVPMGNGSRLASNTASIRQFFGNHQMPRGRRKVASAKKQSSDFESVLQLLGSEGYKVANQ